jgi:hypothetical protein
MSEKAAGKPAAPRRFRRDRSLGAARLLVPVLAARPARSARAKKLPTSPVPLRLMSGNVSPVKGSAPEIPPRLSRAWRPTSEASPMLRSATVGWGWRCPT